MPGLPQISRLAGEANSYAERLFKFPHIGSLPTADATLAITQPAADRGVQFTPAAVDAIVTYTEGYPYFLQEYAKTVWDEATASPVGLGLVTQCQDLVEAKLDSSFFRVRAQRTTELELQYLRAMAELGPEPQKAADVARLMGRSCEQMGPTRSGLIDKGLLYTPGHGMAAFTVPQFDRYMTRTHDLQTPRPRPRQR